MSNKSRMEKCVQVLKDQFSSLQADRVTVGLLDDIPVVAYGRECPLKEVSSVVVNGQRSLSVQVWDTSLVKAVEKALRTSPLGINPSIDGNTLRINFPPLSEERRNELIRVARSYAESARVAVRMVRKDSIDKSKRDADASEASRNRWAKIVQDDTDACVSEINDLLKLKEIDIRG